MILPEKATLQLTFHLREMAKMGGITLVVQSLSLHGVRLSRQLNSHLSETSWCLLGSNQTTFICSHWNLASLSLLQDHHPFIRQIAHAGVASHCPPFPQGIFVAEGKALVISSGLVGRRVA